jgi:hypothetical protein
LIIVFLISFFLVLLVLANMPEHCDGKNPSNVHGKHNNELFYIFIYARKRVRALYEPNYAQKLNFVSSLDRVILTRMSTGYHLNRIII